MCLAYDMHGVYYVCVARCYMRVMRVVCFVCTTDLACFMLRMYTSVVYGLYVVCLLCILYMMCDVLCVRVLCV